MESTLKIYEIVMIGLLRFQLAKGAIGLHGNCMDWLHANDVILEVCLSFVCLGQPDFFYLCPAFGTDLQNFVHLHCGMLPFLLDLVVHVVDMSAKCWRNIQMLQILKKMCRLATFCPKQTQNLPVKPVMGGEPRSDPPSWRWANFQKIFGKFTSISCKKQKLVLFIAFFIISLIVCY